MTIAPIPPPTSHARRPSSTLCTPIPDGGCGTPRAEPSLLEIPAITAITCSRSFPCLPVEIHLEIIDEIARRVPQSPFRDAPTDPANFETLCACALVCKLWLAIARQGIWHNVRLSGRSKGMTFIRLLRAYTCEPDESTPGWSIPSPGHYVSHLSVRETRGNAWDPKWLNDALPHLAVHLPHVRSLELEQVTWEYLSSQSRTACLRAFKCARNLALRGFVFHTIRDMYSFLGEFTGLEVLTLDGVHCDKKTAPTWLFNSAPEIKLPPKRLRGVGLRNVPMEHILEWIMAGSEYWQKMGQSGSGIKSVRVGGVGVSEANIVGKFLRGIGDDLRKVHIGFGTDFVERGDALVKEIELAENKNLEEVHIFGLVVPSPPPVDPFEQEPSPPQRALEALTSLLSQIRSRMRMLSLALYPADVRAMSAIDFEGLTGVFEKDVWSHLDEVRVVIANKGEHELWRVVKERLKVLEKRGVLKVNVGFDEREVV